MDSLLDSKRIEQSILGTILVDPKTIDECINGGLLPGSFSYPLHQEIYKAMLRVHDENGLLDMQDVFEHVPDGMRTNNLIDYFNDLMDVYISSTTQSHYVGKLIDISQRRMLIEAIEEINRQCREEPNHDVLLDSAERSILEITKTRRGSEFLTARQVIQDVDNELNDLINGIHKKSVVTGYSDFDALTGNLKEGELIILAARPAMGKTAFALNLAYQTALRNEGPVAIFSLEMPAAAVMKRIISSISKVNGKKLNDGSLSDQEINNIRQAENLINEQNIVIDDTSLLTMGQIFSKCRKLRATEKRVSLIVIDYLQLIQGNPQRKENRQQEITEISRNLKILAKEMECPVIALSQLSRKVEDRTDHEPQLADLRESGAIEQDADMVMFLYRKSYYDNEECNDPVDIVDVLLKKNRNGSTGKIQLAFEKEISKFSSVSFRNTN